MAHTVLHAIYPSHLTPPTIIIANRSAVRHDERSPPLHQPTSGHAVPHTEAAAEGPAEGGTEEAAAPAGPDANHTDQGISAAE